MHPLIWLAIAAALLVIVWLWKAGKTWARLLLITAAFGCILLSSFVPIPRSIPPALQSWAAQKAARLATCYDAGHRRQALLECMGDFAPDRGTYACERVAHAISE
jgi:hypothetical protein